MRTFPSVSYTHLPDIRHFVYPEVSQLIIAAVPGHQIVIVVIPAKDIGAHPIADTLPAEDLVFIQIIVIILKGYLAVQADGPGEDV